MIVTATVLNVRSGPGTDYRALTQLRRGDDVQVLEARGDWAWVNPGLGWVHRAFLAPISFLAPPNGLDEIERRFGDPGAPECSAGRVQLPAPIKLGWMNAEVSRVACHILMEEVFTKVFREIHDAGLWTKLKTFDGIYNHRQTKNGKKLSTHSWGISIDLNAATNRMGKKGDMDPRIVRIFEKHGFKWLGPVYDPMHFQFATGY